MSKRKGNGLFLLTLCSLLLMVSLIIISSLTPLSQMGKHANQFNSIGMYTAIMMIFACYALPYLLYATGFKPAKYMMAILSGFGILIGLSSILMNIFAGLMTHYSLGNFFTPIVISLLFLLTNVIWYIAAFANRNPSHLSAAKT